MQAGTQDSGLFSSSGGYLLLLDHIFRTFKRQVILTFIVVMLANMMVSQIKAFNIMKEEHSTGRSKCVTMRV